MKGKLGSRYIGSFEVVRRIKPVAYKLALPSHLDKIHEVFHVSMLQKKKKKEKEKDPSRMIPQVPLKIKEDLTIEVKLVKKLD